MRQIMIGDVIGVARIAHRLPHGQRAAAIAMLLHRAHSADKAVKRTGRPHRRWGNGSLLAASASTGTPEPFCSEPEYLEALIETLSQILHWKSEQSQRRHKGRNSP
jgi:hypothetical protein